MQFVFLEKCLSPVPSILLTPVLPAEADANLNCLQARPTGTRCSLPAFRHDANARRTRGSNNVFSCSFSLHHAKPDQQSVLEVEVRSRDNGQVFQASDRNCASPAQQLFSSAPTESGPSGAASRRPRVSGEHQTWSKPTERSQGLGLYNLYK